MRHCLGSVCFLFFSSFWAVRVCTCIAVHHPYGIHMENAVRLFIFFIQFRLRMIPYVFVHTIRNTHTSMHYNFIKAFIRSLSHVCSMVVCCFLFLLFYFFFLYLFSYSLPHGHRTSYYISYSVAEREKERTYLVL